MIATTQPKPACKRGDVVLVLFPHSNLRTAKPRPALVVQADNLQTGLPQVIVAMITSKLFRANHPSRATIRISTSEGQQSGLLTDSVVMTDNLATIIEPAIDRVIGALPMDKVDAALRHTLGLRRTVQRWQHD
jgi:mRNA interferase MazF